MRPYHFQIKAFAGSTYFTIVRNIGMYPLNFVLQLLLPFCQLLNKALQLLAKYAMACCLYAKCSFKNQGLFSRKIIFQVYLLISCFSVA